MDRSLRFGSAASDLSRPIKTRFRYGFALGLTLPDTTTRRLIMQKAVHHPGAPHKILRFYKDSANLDDFRRTSKVKTLRDAP